MRRSAVSPPVPLKPGPKSVPVSQGGEAVIARLLRENESLQALSYRQASKIRELERRLFKANMGETHI